jgi:glycosyltransferase involved in cell wall biosynthesis
MTSGRERRGLRVVMLLENCGYPQDIRVLREARALTAAGHQVSVICPRSPAQPSADQLDGVHVRRYRAPPTPRGVLGYLWEYAYSMMAVFLLSLRLLVRSGFDVVHAHNPPDTFVLIGAFYKLLGKRFVFDHHDLTPEMFAARFGREPPAPIRRALLAFERSSLRVADAVIATNASQKEVETRRAGISAERITIVRNGPDLNELPPPQPKAGDHTDRPLVVGYLGEISFHDGVDQLLRAVAHLAHDIGRRNFVCSIAGDGEAAPWVRSLVEDLGVEQHVRLLGWLDDRDVGRFLDSIDIGVEPAPSNAYNDRCTMIKVMEYMALAKPTVAFSLPENRFSADGAALFVPSNDYRDLALGISALMDDHPSREQLGKLGRKRIEKELSWSRWAPELVRVYKRLH